MSNEVVRQKRFTFTINPELAEALKKQADAEYRSVASLINAVVAEYLKSKGHDIGQE
ncbi:hypothetical protein [Nostoc sp.]|uniref:hypothetical protein n=1 Tax=Nostoc sp. TaxID=1180 RepID=UPI002FFD111E